MIKTVAFPSDLAEKVQAMAKDNRRSFSSQVVYMVETVLAGDRSQQGAELKAFIEAQEARA